jgi:hydroxypyruvate isomerase
MEQHICDSEPIPRVWKLRFAPTIGLNSLDTPMFRHSVGTIDALEHIAFIADHGFAGIEDNFLKLRSPHEQERIGAALRKRNLAMGCFVANPQSWNQPLWVADDREARRKLESDLHDSIDAAKRTGGRVMTVLSGFLPGVPRAYQRRKSYWASRLATASSIPFCFSTTSEMPSRLPKP